MSNNNTILTVAAAAALGIGGYALYKNLAGIKKGIQETTQTVTETATTIYDNPVSKESREILDDLGIIDKDNPIKTLASGSMATNPLEKFGNLFGSLLSKAVDTGIKAAADPADAVKQNIKNFVGATPGNPISTLTNFFGQFFNQSKETSTPIAEKREDMSMVKYTPADYTVDKNGKPISAIEKFALSQMNVDPANVEIIGRALTDEEKEERKKNPLPTKTIEELATQDNFIGRVAKLTLKVKEGGYTGNILQSLKK